MKKLLFGLLFSITIQAQTTNTKMLFEDSFETYEDFSIKDIGDWITLDLDKSRTVGLGAVWKNRLEPQAFIVFNPISIGILNADLNAKTGNKFIGAFAALLPEEGGEGPNNDWLISPPIHLGVSANELHFWVKSLGKATGVKAYKVGVYIEAKKPIDLADFTIISGETPLTVSEKWEQKHYNLDAYADQTVRIGIHFVASDMHLFMMDDFEVTTSTLSTADFFANNFSVFPNPAKDVLNISTKNNIEIKKIELTDVSGSVVKQLLVQREAEVAVNLVGLPSGVYFIAVETSQGKGTSKFIKN
ncbi:choice-of-anchor J domain-containing protein [Flavobacterium sp. CAU 1735]|uniref:T9SS-dependent choice-of-anchor J family protein n=1 Tax=Flavobacterium sp. CAU 1735 TaxID=3140361 RepID=UPI003260EC05